MCDLIEFTLILLVVIGVSVRPHTLGCGSNWPWQAGLQPCGDLGKRNGEENAGPLFVATATCLPVWQRRTPGCVWRLGFGEMIVIALALALKMPF